MGTFRRFEDIDAWQKARALTREIYAASGRVPFAKDFPLRDQIRRAAISIMSNIAEGFGRSGNREFVQFLATAKASVHEVRSQLYVALDQAYISSDEFDALSSTATEIERMLGGLMDYLRRSPMKGPRFAGGAR